MRSRSFCGTAVTLLIVACSPNADSSNPAKAAPPAAAKSFTPAEHTVADFYKNKEYSAGVGRRTRRRSS
jgi:hypothetical protein